jgi:flagellar hook-associated protein 1 FlgK
MSGITGAINTALTGSNNLANEQTPGYSVESVTGNALVGSPGQPGQGVSAPQIQRAASGFAASLLNSANAASTAASAQSTSLTTISNALTNNGDVQTAINQFFQDFSSLAADPTSSRTRRAW